MNKSSNASEVSFLSKAPSPSASLSLNTALNPAYSAAAKVGANVGSSIESESRRRQRNRAVLQRQEDAVQKAITDSEEQFVRNRWTNLTSAEKDILQTAITEDKTSSATLTAQGNKFSKSLYTS